MWYRVACHIFIAQGRRRDRDLAFTLLAYTAIYIAEVGEMKNGIF